MFGTLLLRAQLEVVPDAPHTKGTQAPAGHIQKWNQPKARAPLVESGEKKSIQSQASRQQAPLERSFANMAQLDPLKFGLGRNRQTMGPFSPSISTTVAPWVTEHLKYY
jgi:hypothetical protein